MLSCSKSETYADKIRKERKGINRFFDRNNFSITKQYPENGVFEENQYFLEPNSGVYFHVVDSGNGRRATQGRIVYVRYKDAERILSGDSVFYNNTTIDGYQDYIDFTYGDTYSYTASSITEGWSNYYYKSAGMVAPLQYVGDSAIIRLLVPFNVGSAGQQTSYEPIHFGYVFYDFWKGQGE